MTVHAIRGATTVDVDDAEHIVGRVGTLMKELFDRNNLTNEQVISILFTATPDIHSIYPPAAARQACDLGDIPLIGAQELEVPGGLPLAIRVMMHVDVDVPRNEIKHAFLEGAADLRRDLPS